MAPGVQCTRADARRCGITNGRVFRKAEDPNDLVILLNVADVDHVRAWAPGADLKEAMQNAG